MDWASNLLFMKNTQMALEAVDDRITVFLPPRTVCAFPPFLESCDKLGTVHFGYYIPQAAAVAAHNGIWAVTLWSERQWSKGLSPQLHSSLLSCLRAEELEAERMCTLRQRLYQEITQNLLACNEALSFFD